MVNEASAPPADAHTLIYATDYPVATHPETPNVQFVANLLLAACHYTNHSSPNSSECMLPRLRP